MSVGGGLSAFFKSNPVGMVQDSPTRRYKKPQGEGKITSDLLGAGDDPTSKN
jgi:hypothetical protein